MLMRIAWARAPATVRFPPQTLRFTTAGRMACSAGQLVASTFLRSTKRKSASQLRRRCAARRRLEPLLKFGSSRASRRLRRKPRATRAPCRLTSRSEEHTSELQSHHDLVCRLLLEKKKKNKNKKIIKKKKKNKKKTRKIKI